MGSIAPDGIFPLPLGQQPYGTLNHSSPSHTCTGCGLVVDAGFSFTHAVPVFDWRVLQPAVRRIDLGGKALTNHMKALVSYR